MVVGEQEQPYAAGDPDPVTRVSGYGSPLWTDHPDAVLASPTPACPTVGRGWQRSEVGGSAWPDPVPRALRAIMGAGVSAAAPLEPGLGAPAWAPWEEASPLARLGTWAGWRSDTKVWGYKVQHLQCPVAWGRTDWDPQEDLNHCGVKAGLPTPDTRRPGSVYVGPGCRGTGILPPAGAPAPRCRRSPSAGSLQEAAVPGGGSVLGVRPPTRTQCNGHTQPSDHVSWSHASGTAGPSNANARPSSPRGLL